MEDNTSLPETLKIGELAAASGLTVRALHYYEEIGLLAAASRTDAGHRLYDHADVERLYRISLLRSLGLSLADIARALDDPAWSLKTAVGAHLEQLERRFDQERQLATRLKHLMASMTNNESGLTTDLLAVLEDMTMLENTVQQGISTLVYADLESAYGHLERVFQLGPGQLTRDAAGRVVHAEIHAGDGIVWLHPESPEFELASPRTLGGATSSVSVLVDDVDAHFEHARAEGADIVYPPIDQPYGYREYSARDAERHLWSFMKPLD